MIMFSMSFLIKHTLETPPTPPPTPQKEYFGQGGIHTKVLKLIFLFFKLCDILTDEKDYWKARVIWFKHIIPVPEGFGIS